MDELNWDKVRLYVKGAGRNGSLETRRRVRALRAEYCDADIVRWMSQFPRDVEESEIGLTGEEFAYEFLRAVSIDYEDDRALRLDVREIGKFFN